MAKNLFKELYSIDNLQLAFKRLQTAQDRIYKSYYRDLFIAYEISKDENLKNLSFRLKGHSFNPKEPVRVYLPKSSGLQRTISILNLDDIIVYQAMANVLFDKFIKDRELVEDKTVFSNVFNEKESIYFFRDWKESYKKFKEKIKYFYKNKLRWVAHFDLAAYFDTISQDNLKNLISLKSQEDYKGLLGECLNRWSSHKVSKDIKQGIPQGPLPSSFFSEIYLLNIDLKLQNKDIKYVRFVDDIKIFGNSKQEVLRGVILLDRLCKEIGLIPQGKKYEIIKAESLTEAIGKDASLTIEEKDQILKSGDESVEIFKKAFLGEHMDISAVKYMLLTLGQNAKVRRIVLGNLNRRPELVDFFVFYLEQFSDDLKLGEFIYKNVIKKPSPYEYVEGRYWDLLSKLKLSESYRKEALKLAIFKLTLKVNRDNYALKIGLYKFLITISAKSVIKFLMREGSALVQALAMTSINPESLSNEEYLSLLNNLKLRSSYEPTLIGIYKLYLSLKFDVLKNFVPSSEKDYSMVIKNSLGKKEIVDPIGQILKSKYFVSYFNKWAVIFGKTYKDANEQLNSAINNWFSNRDAWMGYMDSFNALLTRKLIGLLSKKITNVRHPKIVDKDGNLLDYGIILNNNCIESKYNLKILEPFFAFHNRRNNIPISHEIDKKTGKTTKRLSNFEQRKFKNDLRIAYEEIIRIVSLF